MFVVKLALVSLGVLSLAAIGSAQTLSSVPSSTLVGALLHKPGYGSPQNNYQAFDTTGDLAAQANGAAAAVAKDTIAGYPALHDSSFLNDGYYGNGASWISASANSWVKIDLGSVKSFSTFLLGRDRLGGYDDRDPGQFSIAVANSDFYATGDDTNDALEYTTVFDSRLVGFSGTINGSEALQAKLATLTSGRYVKVTFANAGAAIDEFQVQSVPEPASCAALALGGLAMIRRRRQAKKA